MYTCRRILGALLVSHSGYMLHDVRRFDLIKFSEIVFRGSVLYWITVHLGCG